MKKNKHLWPAVLLFSILFFGGFAISNGAHMMLNAMGLVLVVAGTLAAAFISYTSNNLLAAYRVAVNSYRNYAPDEEEIVNTLLNLSMLSRQQGVLALGKEEERSSVLFLSRALGMLVDGLKPEDIRNSLYIEIYFFQQRRGQQERIFRHLARLAPAFGVAGSVVGLIGMLAGIGDTGVIIQTIPIALTSTLYGIVLANFVLIPIAENIYTKTQDELLIHKLIIEGVLLIAEEYNTNHLQTKLEAFITPSVRAERHKSYAEIREQYRKLKERSEQV